MESTQQQVFKAADELLAQGIKPSQQLVRERIGRGSATTIHRALNEWWSDLGDRLANNQQQLADIPVPLQRALEDLWRIAVKQANVQHQGQQQQEQQRLNELRESLQQDKDRFVERADSLSQQLDKAYDRLEKSQEELDGQRQQLLELEKQLYQRTAALEKTQLENKVLEKVVADLQTQLEKR